MSGPELKIIKFPDRDVSDIVGSLRRLADTIERGEYGSVVNLVWVTDSGVDEFDVRVGMLGKAGEGKAVAHLLLAIAQRKLED